MDEDVKNAALEQARRVYWEYAIDGVTCEAAYGLAIHHLMMLLDIDARTACLMMEPPE